MEPGIQAWEHAAVRNKQHHREANEQQHHPQLESARTRVKPAFSLGQQQLSALQRQ